jgi:iron(III) transport system substrate-binding protein
MNKWIALALLACTFLQAQALTVYTSRKEQLIKPVFDLYTQTTGVKINYFTGKAGALYQKIKAEGKRTPADIFMTVDAGNLWFASEKGILAKLKSPALKKNIPEHLRGPKMDWFGLSMRARTIVYNPSKVNSHEILSYENLAQAKWQGKLLLRTSKKVYNQSLIAVKIQENGEAQTEAMVKGWVKNLAQPVYSSDTKLLEAMAKGAGDLGIVNTYYLGRLQAKNPDFPLKVYWPNQSTSGTHVNISGAGVLKTSKNKVEAQKFLEWLSQPAAQKLFAELNMEFPVVSSVALHPLVQAWGSFKPSATSLEFAGKNQKNAIMLMQRAGYK